MMNLAKMIPNYYDRRLTSRGEQEIFEIFKSAPNTGDWIVLHSLGLSRHVKKEFGEIDFVVLAPNLGIFCLEVKSGEVRVKDGVWHFTNRQGQTFKKVRGPFEQAQEGMFSLIEAIQNRFGKFDRVSNLLFGYGVMFPDIEYQASGLNQEKWQVYNLSSKNRPITDYIQQLHRNFKRKRKRIIPNKKDIQKLVSFLRSDFEYIIPTWYKEKIVEDELINLTEEQFYCLDGMAENKRCLFEGGAGTGKTMLAIESARRSVINNQKTLFLCYNSLLAEELKKKFIGEKLIKVSTFHGLLLGICPSARQEKNDPRFYTEILPEKAFEILVDQRNEKFDKLIIDESQDLLRDNYLIILDELLKGGLKDGEWQMFCDLNNQAIYTEKNREEMLGLLEEYSKFSRFKLRRNCRNTKYIAEHALLLSNADRGTYVVSEIEGNFVDYNFYQDEKEMTEKLLVLLKELKKEKIENDSITILSTSKLGNSAINSLSSNKIRIHDLTSRKPKPEGYIGFSTVHSYKGLENKYIILTDINQLKTKEIQQLLYVGMTRAKIGLHVFLKSNLKDTLLQLASSIVGRIQNEE